MKMLRAIKFLVAIFWNKLLVAIWNNFLLIISKWLPLNAIFLKQMEGSLCMEDSSSSDVDDDDGNIIVKEEGSDRLPKGLRRDLMPKHVGLILDGNRRWAKQRGLSHVEGYQYGLVALANYIRLCSEWQIPVISLYLFSSEKWFRPQEEVDYLMQAFEKSLTGEFGVSLRKGARVSVIGDRSLLPISLQQTIKEVEEATKDNTKLHIIIAMSYSGQNDIAQACKNIATKVKEGLIEPEDVTKSLLEQELETKVVDTPNPDFLIRTSGELRISNYYLWQSAYTELYFTKTLWPDFGETDFVKALRSFQRRGRRFGRN